MTSHQFILIGLKLFSFFSPVQSTNMKFELERQNTLKVNSIMVQKNADCSVLHFIKFCFHIFMVNSSMENPLSRNKIGMIKPILKKLTN